MVDIIAMSMITMTYVQVVDIITMQMITISYNYMKLLMFNLQY